MFDDDTYFETVMFRYKLGLDRVQMNQPELHVPVYPGWRDRSLYKLGRALVAFGRRLQKRHSYSTTTVYHPAYRTG